MTSKTNFYYKECELIDPHKVNAYLELRLDPLDPKNLVLESSWGESALDMTPIVKATETMTYLKLDPEGTPEYLEYDGEDGLPQCIHGDDLSRIISLHLLKDVDQVTPPSNGDVYMFNEETNKFETFNITGAITNLVNQITALQDRVALLEGKVATIMTILTKPTGIPEDTVLVWGNINDYSDTTNTNQRTSGLFTHSTSTDVTNDQFFA